MGTRNTEVLVVVKMDKARVNRQVFKCCLNIEMLCYSQMSIPRYVELQCSYYEPNQLQSAFIQ